MTTRENELLAFALKVERAPVRKVAVLSDLSRIPHIQDPTFFGVLRRRLEASVARLDSIGFELPNYRICHILDPEPAVGLEKSLARISKLLADHGKLPIEVRSFDLLHRAGDFADHCRLLAAETQTSAAVGADELTEEDENLDRYLTIEENLHSADISALIREQPIYDFTDADRPKIVGHELSSAIEQLEELYGVPIRSNPWLFSRVTEILDERMMVHLMHDHNMSRRRICINMHLSTVLGAGFREFAHRTSFGWQENLVIEVPFLEVRESPEDFRSVLEILRYNHGLAAVDDVPLAQLDRVPDLPDQIRFVKVRWSDADPAPPADGSPDLLRQIERFGTERCVLTHCENLASVEAGLKLGFRVLQGHGVDADVAELRRRQVDRTIASMEMRQSIFDGSDDEEPPGFLEKWLRRMFSPHGRKEQDEI